MLSYSVVSMPGLTAVFLHLPIPPSFLALFQVCTATCRVMCACIFQPFQIPNPVYIVVVQTVTLKPCRWNPLLKGWMWVYQAVAEFLPRTSSGNQFTNALPNSKLITFTTHMQNNRPKIIKYYSH